MNEILAATLQHNRDSVFGKQLESCRKMIDAVSIAGLTIGVFDQVLKLGERTAELTSDIRAFSEAS